MAAVAGVLADGLADSTVTEVLTDPSGAVFYDKLFGTLERQVGRDVRPERLTRIITGIAGLLHTPVRDGLLQGRLFLDGSRIQAVLPPVSSGPVLSIRKHRKIGDDFPALTLDDYEMPSAYRDALAAIVAKRENLLIVGPTSSGKTTFANAFLNYIAHTYRSDRVVTAEDTPELSCVSESWAPLYTTEVVSMRTLVKTAMRLRPDWLVVGETRDESAIDMIMGLTRGHAGFSTVHGGSCANGLTNILQLTRLGGEETVSPEMVGEAIHAVLLMKRAPLGGPRYIDDFARNMGWRKKRFHLEPIPRN
jgi:type IV secretion system protein VirB11